MARYIQNQGNTAITGDRCAGHAWGTVQHFTQGFDHHFFLADQLIHHKPYFLSADADNHHVGF